MSTNQNTEATATATRRIKGVIGQDKAVAFLERELRNLEKGHLMPNLGMFDDTGLGKTHLVTSFLDALPAGIESISINCKDKLNLTDEQGKAYFKAVHEALSGEKQLIVHLDEYGSANGSGSLQNWMQSHLSKTADSNAVFTIHGGSPLPYNPRNLGYIITSFSPAKAAVDVLNRFPQPAELLLGNYNVGELSEILKIAMRREFALNGVKQCNGTNPAVAMIARSMRGNARQCNDVAKEVRRAAADAEGYKLTLETAEAVMRAVGVYPHGLNQGEVKLLSALSTGAKNRDTLKEKTGLARESWTRAINFLQDGTGTGKPFQCVNAEGEEVPEKVGSLVDYEKGKWHLTRHGLVIYSILSKKGWIKDAE